MNIDIPILFLSKVPVNEPPQVFPKRAPMERAAHLQGLYYTSHKFIIKISLNEEIFTFSQRP